MFSLIHPALAKAAAIDQITRPRPPKQRSTRRFALRRAPAPQAARPAEATRPVAAKPAPR